LKKFEYRVLMKAVHEEDLKEKKDDRFKQGLFLLGRRKVSKGPLKMLELKHQVCPGFVEGQDPDVEELGPALYKEYAQKKGVTLILGVGVISALAAFQGQICPSVVSDKA
jgi:hypothetical protein